MEEKSWGDKAIDLAFKLPLVIVDRESFLRDNFRTKFASDKVDEIITTSPIKAGVDKEILIDIAEGCINYELIVATAVSAVAGLPGGPAAALAVFGDAAQVLVHEIVLIQKLAYLFGYQDFRDSNGSFDDTSKAFIMVFLGVMFGVNKANEAINYISKLLAEKVSKDILKNALTKTAWYPMLKKICSELGIKMTKRILSDSAKKALPIFGGIISGGVTYYFFAEESRKLLDYLSENPFIG